MLDGFDLADLRVWLQYGYRVVNGQPFPRYQQRRYVRDRSIKGCGRRGRPVWRNPGPLLQVEVGGYFGLVHGDDLWITNIRVPERDGAYVPTSVLRRHVMSQEDADGLVRAAQAEVEG